MATIPPQLIGQSPAWLATLDQISGSAALDRSMLVVGERGTGKEMVAARLHFLSPRWEQTYITLNCAALSEELLDSELFGHEAGAFTGASKRRLGRFERADKGTLFLDEIANASARVQEKLLRVIEYGEFERLGGDKTIKVDVRVVGATNVDLPKAVEDGKFRADLLDRLAFDVITLPPLRVRKADILPLAEHFGKRMTVELSVESFPGFTQEVLEFLTEYNWPGNVRELKNVTERSIGRAFNEHNNLNEPIAHINIDPFEAPWRLTETSEPSTASSPTQQTSADTPLAIIGTDFTARTHAFELGLVKEALSQSKNHQGKAADYLELSYHQFRGLLRKHGLRK
ncbi:MAG: phage shock protein operon transcriptional activator [Robiginitomaculum sp.]|nr:MAG: phage shock protein operon transcriptional activator [Robiginitomaculum sp.]